MCRLQCHLKYKRRSFSLWAKKKIQKLQCLATYSNSETKYLHHLMLQSPLTAHIHKQGSGRELHPFICMQPRIGISNKICNLANVSIYYQTGSQRSAAGSTMNGNTLVIFYWVTIFLWFHPPMFTQCVLLQSCGYRWVTEDRAALTS